MYTRFKNKIKSPLLSYPQGMIYARLLFREKRFFIHAQTHNKHIIAHTNNTGSMLGLLRQGTPILLSPAQTPKRKLAWTLEAIWLGGSFPHEASLPFGKTPGTGQGFWVGVNTAVPNRFIEAAFHAQQYPWTHGYTHFKREAKRGNSRLDACLEGEGLPPLWVECKNVTLVEDGVAMFPDAASERACKHLEEMMNIVSQGQRARMFYALQRPDAKCFCPATMIDSKYAERFYQAVEVGVEMIVQPLCVSEMGIDAEMGNNGKERSVVIQKTCV